MTTIKTKNNSYLEYSIDEDDNEVILQDIKSNQKGDGIILMREFLFICKNEYKGYTISLCAYPTDGTIDEESLVSFYKGFGFKVVESTATGTIMEK